MSVMGFKPDRLSFCGPTTAGEAVLDAGRLRILSGILLLLIFRTAYLFVFPLELVPDEAYYWDWSRHLAWSYYSKPPLIAWLIAFSTWVGGPTEFAIRFPATLLGCVGLWPVYELGRRLYDHRTGMLSAVLVAATPGTTALCVLMTIDAPFLFAWSAALCCLWRLFETRSTSPLWMLMAIVTTGAGLLAKQTMLAIFPLALLFLAIGRESRGKMSVTAVCTWIAGSLLCLSPVLWWNVKNHWITVDHMRSHFALEGLSLFGRVIRFLEFWVTQFGILSPFLCTLMLAVTAVLLVQFRKQKPRERFLICFGVVPMLAIDVFCFFRRVQPNWPVAFHLCSLILVAAWASGQIDIPRIENLRRWIRLSVVGAFVFSIVLAAIPFILPLTPLSGSKLDLVARLRGWKELGIAVHDKLLEFPDPSNTLVVAATVRGPVSELAYYMPGQPQVYRWAGERVIKSQYEMWSGPLDAAGRDALIVGPPDEELPSSLASAFDRIEDRGMVVIPLGSDRAHRFRIWRGSTLSHWPQRFTMVDHASPHTAPLSSLR